MRQTFCVLVRIAGGAIGLLAAGMALGWLPVLLFCGGRLVAAADAASFMLFVLCFPAGAMFGVAAGTALANRVLRQRISFWEAFVGGVLGLAAGGLLEVLYNVALVHNSLDARLFFTLSGVVLYVPVWAGAVIGSGWKVKPVGGCSPGNHLCRSCGCREADGAKFCRWCGADQE